MIYWINELGRFVKDELAIYAAVWRAKRINKALAVIHPWGEPYSREWCYEFFKSGSTSSLVVARGAITRILEERTT